MLPDPRPVQPSTVLALSRTLRAALCQKAGRDEGMVPPIEQRDAAIDLNQTPARSL